jgi:hypothetical protein
MERAEAKGQSMPNQIPREEDTLWLLEWNKNF